MQEDHTVVTEHKIKTYFEDIAPLIKYIQIDTDENLPLVGKVNGTIGISGAPIKGWKNMWYGKYSLLQKIAEENNPTSIVINTRFDILTVAKNNCATIRDSFTEQSIIDFMDAHLQSTFKENAFMFEQEHVGIDNVYIGSVKTNLELASHFHNHLDSILEKYPNIRSHEKMVFNENKVIFN